MNERKLWRFFFEGGDRPKGAQTRLAERGGFEPPVGYKPTHAFQACALNHSATSPSAAANVTLPRGAGNLFHWPSGDASRGRKIAACKPEPLRRVVCPTNPLIVARALPQ